MDNVIQLPRQQRGGSDDLGLEIRASSFDEDKRTIDLIWSTGAKVRRYTWRDGAIDEELSMNPNHVRLDRMRNGAPLLNTHASYNLSNVIGTTVPGTVRVEGGKGLVTVQFSRRPDVEGIVQDVRDGILRNISVGYRVLKVEKTEGEDGDVPVWRVVDWEPQEISIVPIPADPGARMRSADRGAEELSPVIVTREGGLVRPAGALDALRRRMRMRAAALRIG